MATTDDPIRELGKELGGKAAPVRPTDEVDPNAEIFGDDELEDAKNGPTTLSDLEDELAEEVEAQDFYVPVPRRPGYELRFPDALDGEKMKLWGRKCSDKKSIGGIDELKLSLLVLANQNTGIRRQGEIVTEAGVPVTVRSKGFLDLMKVGRPFDALQKLYGSDGHVMAAAREVLSECGYGEDLVAATKDPTGRSSSG